MKPPLGIIIAQALSFEKASHLLLSFLDLRLFMLDQFLGQRLDARIVWSDTHGNIDIGSSLLNLTKTLICLGSSVVGLDVLIVQGQDLGSRVDALFILLLLKVNGAKVVLDSNRDFLSCLVDLFASSSSLRRPEGTPRDGYGQFCFSFSNDP